MCYVMHIYIYGCYKINSYSCISKAFNGFVNTQHQKNRTLVPTQQLKHTFCFVVVYKIPLFFIIYFFLCVCVFVIVASC